MDAAVIRLQLPAGEAFIAAFDDAADKYAGRRGFADNGALFTQITSAAVRAVASGSPATIELVARETMGQIVAVVSGQGPTHTMSTAGVAAVNTAASGLPNPPVVDAARGTIEFSLPVA